MRKKYLFGILAIIVGISFNHLTAQTTGDYRSVTTAAPGSGAVIAVATLSSNAVTGWTITNGGSGYTDGATVTVTYGTNTATFVATVSGGAITGVTTANVIAGVNGGFNSTPSNNTVTVTPAYLWTTAAAWETYDGSGWVTAGSAPGISSTTSNITIQSGPAILLTAATTCGTLTLNGKLGVIFTLGISTSFVFNASSFYAPQLLTSSGTTTISSGAVFIGGITTAGNVTIDGQLRGTVKAGGTVQTWTLKGASPTVTVNSGGVLGGTGVNVNGEGIRIYLDHSGTATFQGEGVVNIARLHTNNNNTSHQTTTVNIHMNINNTASNVQVLTLQNGNNGSGTKILNIGAGKTVKLTQANGYLHAASGTGGGTNTCGAISYNVYGTLDVSSGQFNLVSNGGSMGNTVAVNVKSGGTLKLGATNNLYTTLAGQTAPAIVPESGSTVEIAGSSAPVFNVGNVSGATVPSYPSSYYNLTVNNSNGVTLPNSTAVNNILNLAAGTLATGSNTLTLNNTITGSGLINTSTTGTLAFGGTSEQALSAANLTSGAVNVLTVNGGAKLTTSGNITATTLNILNDGTTYGTGTLKDASGTLTAASTNVSQFITGGRNWYLSSPVTGATGSGVLATSTATTAPAYFAWYDETKGSALPWTTETSTLLPGTGYIAVNDKDAPSTSGTITFTGVLNTGSKTVDLSYSSNQIKKGFNLVGNPYPAYLDIDNLKNNDDLEPSYWYRTYVEAGYVFDTENLPSGLGTSLSGLQMTGNIPPLQAFWLRAKNTCQLTFSSADCDHQDVSNNKFRVRSVTNADQKVLRLQISNSIASDQTIVYFNSNASNGYDDYDSPKMSNGNAAIPEIYTTAGTEKVAINGFNNVAQVMEIPLGFTTGQSNTFTLKATQLSNIGANTQIVLKDKLTDREHILTEGSDYTFTSEVTNNSDRFSILFKSGSVSTGIEGNSTDLIRVNQNEQNRIVITMNSNSDSGTVSVYSVAGYLICEEPLQGKTTVLNHNLINGVYLVKVNTGTESVASKIILR